MLRNVISPIRPISSVASCSAKERYLPQPTPPYHDRIIPCRTSKYTTAKNNNPSGAASQPIAYNSQKNGCSEGERVRKREWKRGSLKQRGLNHQILKSLVIHMWSFIPVMWPTQPFKHSVIQSNWCRSARLPSAGHFSFHLGIEYDQNVIKCPSRQGWVQCRRR